MNGIVTLSLSGASGTVNSDPVTTQVFSMLMTYCS